MHQVYEDYLFSQGYFVSVLAFESPEEQTAVAAKSPHPAEALVALAHFAEIRITEHPELASLHMLEVAARNLGKNVPEPFMRGFPQSALKLSPDELLVDQLVNYFITYNLGDMSQRRHSLLEEYYGRSAFSENVEPKLFAIISPEKAERILSRAVDGLLASTRPISEANLALLVQYLRDHDRPVDACGSKDTVCRLLLELREARFIDLLTLPDTIRLVEWMLELGYPKMTIKKLNLKNRDRKLVTQVIDRQFERGGCDITACLEKKRLWNGLLHHIHYRPRCPEAQTLCNAVRGHVARSAYSEFEQRMNALDVRGATDALLASKGPVAILRNLNYLLSRCVSDADIDYVLDSVETRNKIVLAQLLVRFSANNRNQRIFKFVHLNKMKKFAELPEKAESRESALSDEVAKRALERIKSLLESACCGTLGKVYVDDTLRNIALPLQEATSMGGFGTLPHGTRLPIPLDKKLRAFIYWEKVNDIDLSCFGIDNQGSAEEFSWRTMADLQSSALTFSGDETSGYRGGSEYFDIDLERFRELHPESSYVVFNANVYTYGTMFSTCVCRAGYMLRDLEDSGEVFEPKTVKSSFAINCSSAAAYLFAIDLVEGAIVWLNIAEDSMRRVAGTGDMRFLLDYMHITDAINLRDFARMLATEIVNTPEEADVVFSDEVLELREDQEQIRGFDTARIVELLNA